MKAEQFFAALALGLLGYMAYTVFRPAKSAAATRAISQGVTLPAPVYTAADLDELYL